MTNWWNMSIFCNLTPSFIRFCNNDLTLNIKMVNHSFNKLNLYKLSMAKSKPKNIEIRNILAGKRPLT